MIGLKRAEQVVPLGRGFIFKRTDTLYYLRRPQPIDIYCFDHWIWVFMFRLPRLLVFDSVPHDGVLTVSWLPRRKTTRRMASMVGMPKTRTQMIQKDPLRGLGRDFWRFRHPDM